MNTDYIYWTFSAAAQSISALVAFLLTGYALVHTIMESARERDDFNQPVRINAERRRVIPTHVKLEVWQRDGAKCSMCGATDELHFDHILPFAKGGTSLTAANVQLLCARHNLAKSDRIE